MQSTPWRVPALVFLVIVLVALGAYVFLGNKESVTRTTQPLPGGLDASFLGVLAKEGGRVVAYIGQQDGSFTTLPELPNGETFVALARGGTKLVVLAKQSDSDVNVIYRYTDGTYSPVFEGEALSALSVSPDGALIGFVHTQGGIPNAYALTEGEATPILLGEGTRVLFSYFGENIGAWIIYGNSALLHMHTDAGWDGGRVVYRSEQSLTSFAANDLGQFAFKDPVSGGAEQRYVESVSPLETTQLASYGTREYPALFFRGADVYSFLSNEDGSVVVSRLEETPEDVPYPIITVIPDVADVFVLNP